MWMPGMHDWRQILTYYPALTHVLMNWRVSGGWNGSVAHGEVTKIFQLLQLAKLPLDSCSWLVQCQARSDSDATLEVSRHPPGLAKARIAAVAAAQGRQLGKDGSLPRPLADEPASATPEQLADLASASEGQLPLGASPPPPTWLPPPPMPPLVKAHVSKPSFFRPSPGGVPSSRPVKLPPPPPPPPGRRPGEVRSSGAASGAPEAILFFVGRQSDAAWDPHSQRGFLDGATVSAQTATAIANLGYRVVVAGHIVAGTRGMVHFVHEDRLRLVSPPVNKRELLAGLPEWLGDVPPGEPLFDHIVIVRFVAQFTLRFQASHAARAAARPATEHAPTHLARHMRLAARAPPHALRRICAPLHAPHYMHPTTCAPLHAPHCTRLAACVPPASPLPEPSSRHSARRL